MSFQTSRRWSAENCDDICETTATRRTSERLGRWQYWKEEIWDWYLLQALEEVLEHGSRKVEAGFHAETKYLDHDPIQLDRIMV